MKRILVEEANGHDGHPFIDRTDEPMPAITASRPVSIQVYDDGRSEPRMTNEKPSYRVPLMSEIAAFPWNGRKVASTFSGAGGSCTGYRIAGCKVVWANEFVPIAQESYKANAAPGSILDGRDIKLVKPEDIFRATGLRVGELDIFDGSPPCQAFSTAGQREKGWGKKKKYEHGAEQCNERLFDEYIRLLRGLKPKAFVAENVSGMVKGTVKGMFIEILKALKASGYRVEARLLDAQWLGVPQARQRIIFVGIREDLNAAPEFPKPLPYRYSVRDALPYIACAIHDTSGQPQYSAGDITERPAPTVLADRSSSYQVVDLRLPPSRDRAYDGKDTYITRYAIGREWDKLHPGQKSDKYMNLVKAHPDRPCPTVTTQGQLNAASVVHPTERRKFTIAELKRICSFPDDFILKGSYAQQWERLGNSVPPVMMSHVARVVCATLDQVEGRET